MALEPKPWRPQPYVYQDEAELLEQARALSGHNSGELAKAVGQERYNESSSATGKTGVGNLVEWFFGKPPNNSDSPDVAELGIEIKTIPLELRGRKTKAWGPKEPTSITMIDYGRVFQERWTDAYVRKKLKRILWIPYVHDYDDKRLHIFRDPFLWSPDPEDWPQYGQDYDVVREMIGRGLAHELSEEMSVVLAARRKGESEGTRPQPKSSLRAPSRAWALKGSYTGAMLNRQNGLPALSILELAERARKRATRPARRLGDVRTLDGALDFVLQEFRRFEGKNTTDITKALGIQMERSKNRHSAALRAIIGLPRRGSVLELDKLGIRLHVLDVREKDDWPFEGVPFPAMVLRNLVEEEWEDSQMADHVDRIIFVPTYSDTGALPEPHKLGRAFLWQPTAEDRDVIRKEWLSFQRFVQQCRLDRAPGQAVTQRIHMRPHGRRGDDVDVDPCGNKVTKQCFWLNQRFVQTLLTAERRRGRAKAG